MRNELRVRLGARWCVVALLLAPALFGVLRFGPRAALVLMLSTSVCMLAGILPRLVAGQTFRWFNSGSLITGLLIGLTVTAHIPLYMVIVGGLVAEIAGKAPLPGLGRNLFNPAAFGRAAIALLEYLDPSPPSSGLDVVSGASPLMTAAGGHPRPAYLDMLIGLREGSIGETSTLVLGIVGVAMLGWVVLKREAALATLIMVPIVVLCLPASSRVVGHAPWALNPVVYLAGSSYLLIAIFYATDPVTTPRTRLGGVLFGMGTAVLGVAGRFYYSIPGAEMMGVLVMNLFTPALDAMVQGLSLSKSMPKLAPAGVMPNPTLTFYEGQRLHGRDNEVPEFARLDTILKPEQAQPFASFAHVSSRPLSETISKVGQSGLAGCGGAYFPVAAKWEAALSYPGPRVVVVNGQEGEPGTFKDRYMMLHHPRLVVEGAMIAARVVEADHVIVVVDPEWERGREALEAAYLEFCNLRGEPPLRWRTTFGPGLYITGEESALLEFLEGRRGEPQLRPPFPVERGLWGRPTVVHNVETLAWLPAILRGSVERIEDRVCHKLVSLSGAVQRPGIYEVPLGCTLSSILDLAGGLLPNRTLKAYAVGGPSGGYLPPESGDLAFARGTLHSAGAMLGAGSIEVVSDTDCLIHHALRSCTFFRNETCGRCSPCRLGTHEMERLWGVLQAGEGDQETLQGLKDVAEVLQAASSCGLGKGAPTRILSVLRYWPEEIEAHLRSSSPNQTKECPICPKSR